MSTTTSNAAGQAPARATIDSHLSDPKYGFDFVVATTQASINATMAQFLRRYDGEALVVQYRYDDNEDSSEVLEVEGAAPWTVDPFTVPDGARSGSPEVSALADAGFAFAFRARLGVPAGARRVPDVIRLDKLSSTMVTYQLFFAEFEVVQLDYGPRNRTSWRHFTQDPKAPWLFTFAVTLASYEDKGNKFSSLPDAVQKRMKNLGADAFSVEQLYLDLNTPGLQDAPVISGLESSSTAYEKLQKVFVNKYWKTLKDGGSTKVPLGYTVKPARPDPTKPSIEPTDIAKAVSAHRDENGKGQPTGKYDLYCLNYLVVGNGKRMPPFGGFDWNWVVDPANPPDGVIAINRNSFADFVSKLLSPPLLDCCIQPTVRVWTDFPYVRCSVNKEAARYKPVYARVPDPDPAKVLTFSYTSDSVYDSTLGAFGNSAELQAFTDSTVSFSGNTIVVATTFRLRADIRGFMEDSKKGNIVHFRVKATYVLSVVGNELKVERAGEPQREELDSTRGSSNFLEGLNSVTGGIVDTARGYFNNVERYLKDFDTKVAQILNGPGWVFPGGNTFVFKDVRFSPNQDLLSTLTYREIPPAGSADVPTSR